MKGSLVDTNKRVKEGQGIKSAGCTTGVGNYGTKRFVKELRLKQQLRHFWQISLSRISDVGSQAQLAA